MRAKEEKSGWSGEKSPGRKAAGFLLVFRVAVGGGDSIFSVCGLLRDQLLPDLLFGKLGDRGGGIYGRGAYRVCQWLTAEVNDLSSQVERDADGIMRADDGVQERAVKAMQRWGRHIRNCPVTIRSLRDFLIPWILSVQQLSGIYSPFTIEANYNSDGRL